MKLDNLRNVICVIQITTLSDVFETFSFIFDYFKRDCFRKTGD